MLRESSSQAAEAVQENVEIASPDHSKDRARAPKHAEGDTEEDEERVLLASEVNDRAVMMAFLAYPSVQAEATRY